MTRPGILVLCSTRRGIAFVRRLIELRPDARLCVCSFPGAPWEPPYLEELRDWCLSAGHFFVQAAIIGPNPCRLPIFMLWCLTHTGHIDTDGSLFLPEVSLHPGLM